MKTGLAVKINTNELKYNDDGNLGLNDELLKKIDYAPEYIPPTTTNVIAYVDQTFAGRGQINDKTQPFNKLEDAIAALQACRATKKINFIITLLKDYDLVNITGLDIGHPDCINQSTSLLTIQGDPNSEKNIKINIKQVNKGWDEQVLNLTGYIQIRYLDFIGWKLDNINNTNVNIFRGKTGNALYNEIVPNTKWNVSALSVKEFCTCLINNCGFKYFEDSIVINAYRKNIYFKLYI